MIMQFNQVEKGIAVGTFYTKTQNHERGLCSRKLNSWGVPKDRVRGGSVKMWSEWLLDIKILRILQCHTKGKIFSSFFLFWKHIWMRVLKLKCSWFAMLCQFLQYGQVTQPYIYILFSHIIFPVLYLRFHCLSILNVIVCIYTPQTPSPSHSLPSPPLAEI